MWMVLGQILPSNLYHRQRQFTDLYLEQRCCRSGQAVSGNRVKRLEPDEAFMVIGIAALQHWEMFAVNSKLKAVAKVSATKHITGASLNPLGARKMWAGRCLDGHSRRTSHSKRHSFLWEHRSVSLALALAGRQKLRTAGLLCIVWGPSCRLQVESEVRFWKWWQNLICRPRLQVGSLRQHFAMRPRKDH